MLIKFDFKKTRKRPCVIVSYKSKNFITVNILVDDGLIAVTYDVLVNDLVNNLQKNFKKNKRMLD